MLCHGIQAAAAGQDGVHFEPEDLSKAEPLREDIRGLVRVGCEDKAWSPTKIKAWDVRATKKGKGIHDNAAAFGQVRTRSWAHAVYIKQHPCYLHCWCLVCLACFGWH